MPKWLKFDISALLAKYGETFPGHSFLSKGSFWGKSLLGRNSSRQKSIGETGKYDLFVVGQNGKNYNREVAKTKKIHPRGFLKEIFTDFCSVKKIHQM